MDSIVQLASSVFPVFLGFVLTGHKTILMSLLLLEYLKGLCGVI